MSMSLGVGALRMLARSLCRRAIALDLDRALLDEPLQRLVIHGVVRDLPCLVGAEMKNFALGQGNLDRLM